MDKEPDWEAYDISYQLDELDDEEENEKELVIGIEIPPCPKCKNIFCTCDKKKTKKEK